MAYTNDVPSHFIFNILDEYEIHIMSCSVRGSSRTQRTLSQQQPFILFPFHIIHLYNILFRSLPLSLSLCLFFPVILSVHVSLPLHLSLLSGRSRCSSSFKRFIYIILL